MPPGTTVTAILLPSGDHANPVTLAEALDRSTWRLVPSAEPTIRPSCPPPRISDPSGEKAGDTRSTGSRSRDASDRVPGVALGVVVNVSVATGFGVADTAAA